MGSRPLVEQTLNIVRGIKKIHPNAEYHEAAHQNSLPMHATGK